jgi:carboxyl-terminal processing protease
MSLKKKPVFAFLLLCCVGLFTARPSHGTHPAHYPEKRIFYDSLSIVMNKYIVPVENWLLFEGALYGFQSHVGAADFILNSQKGRVEIVANDIEPVFFLKKKIDFNAIELIDSISAVIDMIFELFPEKDKKTLINAAISGMVATLDPNSYYIEPEDFQRIRAQNRGIYEGIGLEITTRNGTVSVVSPYEGTPAFRKGLLPNDRIIGVNGELTKGMHIFEVSEKIRGKKGESVTLTIERDGWDGPRDIILIKDTISHRTLKSFELEPGFGYIRIINFLGSTYNDFSLALAKLQEIAPLEGLVIDLRYTPGGLLDQSLSIADYFLNKGILSRTQSRIQSDDKIFYAQPEGVTINYPIIALVNEGSASGSEIVASALRDNYRAIILGAKTYGKGLVQTVFPIATGGAIRLTTSMLLTPDGAKIQDIGITPDLTINPVLLDYEVGTKNTPGSLERLEVGATKDDPSLELCLDILKLSLLAQDTSGDDLPEGLSEEQKIARKHFNRLLKAVDEVNPRTKIPTF